MKAKLIPIGNSRGVRIPLSVIKECGFGDRVDLRVDQGAVILSPARAPRAGWDSAFERMAASGDDAPLVPETLDHGWDDEEWEW